MPENPLDPGPQAADRLVGLVVKASASIAEDPGFFFFFCVPQLYLWGSPFLGEIFAYVTVS